MGSKVFGTDHCWHQSLLEQFAVGFEVAGKEKITRKRRKLSDYSNQVVQCRWRKERKNREKKTVKLVSFFFFLVTETVLVCVCVANLQKQGLIFILVTSTLLFIFTPKPDIYKP